MEIIKRDKHHLLVRISVPSDYDGAQPKIRFSLIAPKVSNEPIKLGNTCERTTTDGFLTYLRLLEVSITRENLGEIIELLDKMHPWQTILSEANLDHLIMPPTPQARTTIAKYANEIFPPMFQRASDTNSITVWIVDELTGNLEQWKIFEDFQGEKTVEIKVVEERLNRTLYWE